MATKNKMSHEAWEEFKKQTKPEGEYLPIPKAKKGIAPRRVRRKEEREAKKEGRKE